MNGTSNKKTAIIKEISGYLIFAAILAVVFLFVLKVAFVKGDSMNDTYHDGNILLCLRLGKPQKGDVIICDTNIEETFIKRVIATAGDTVFVDFENGTVEINGKVIDEPYIKEPTYLDEGGWEYPITVPDGCYFVMGDNRNNSKDSRSSEIGYIKDDQILGRVLFKI